MKTQQQRSNSIASVEAKGDGLAILFFLIGAAHIYGVLKSRQARANSALQFTFEGYFKFVAFAIFIIGTLEVLSLRV
ncbi:MAG: hypothetical protein J7641_06865 [Cyanobacteria bacterium SID2]|nr:hypothetical protein [Cyanobacteria bacterium SID2]MBP0004726.1 hypothetical protein [Cyanobacteria bacterium SBC]